MKHPLISVVVPVYGVEEYIGKFAESIFRQTYDNLQLIFVNDGTKDRSIEIVKSMLDGEYAAWKTKTVIFEKENEGVAAARMDGLKLVKGDYVIQFDPDDYIDPDTMENIAAVAEKTDSDLIYFDFIIYGEKGPFYWTHGDYPDCQAMMNAMVKGRTMRSLASKCYKTSVCLNGPLVAPVGPFAEDYILNVQLLSRCRSLYHIRKGFYHYIYTREGSQMNNLTPESRRGGVLNLMLLHDLYSSDVENSPLRDSWDYFNYAIGYHIMKGKQADMVHKYPQVRDFILSARILPKSVLGLSFNRQLRIKLYFRINSRKALLCHSL